MNLLRLIGFLCSPKAFATKEFVETKETNRLFEYDSINGNLSWNQISLNASTWLQFALSFALRSQWASTVFFFSNYSELSTNLPPVIYKQFNSVGKSVNIHTTSRPFLPRSLLHQNRKLGVVYLCDIPDEDFLTKVSELDLFDSYRSWLIIELGMNSGKNRLDDILNGLNIGLNANMVVAKVESKTGMASANLPSTGTPGYRAKKRKDNPNKKRQKRELPGNLNLIIHLVQVYKGSKTENDTLAFDLGFWDVPNGLYRVKDVVNEEHRWDLGGSKIQIGVKNSSQNSHATSMAIDRFAKEGEKDEEKNFMELLSCLIYAINARGANASFFNDVKVDTSKSSCKNTGICFELVKFEKLGWRNEEGSWTHLLGGVVDETIEFALETIDVNLDKTDDMTFTYEIITTTNNIYFRRPDSGKMRDIFLAPFGPKLLLCVLGTSFLLAIVMIFITVVYYQIECKKTNLKIRILPGETAKKEEKRWKISDAILWSISILCMQGSQWSPKSISGNLLLINGLLFALVIYNSFAAFITSVLSFKTVKIKNLEDLADSDFAFGYTLGNADELFLRTVNSTLLRELYFKGLRENDGVSDPIAGMRRAAKGKYAFFLAARTARRALRTVVAHNKRCQFQELYLSVTENHASIPMRRKSSLKKIINLKIIRLMETGLLRRFQKLILLSMPRCIDRTTFNSARLADVYSAFFVLIAGWLGSVLILLVETIWWKKNKLKTKDNKVDRGLADDRLKDLNAFYYK